MTDNRDDEEFEVLLSGYLDGELGPAERERFELMLQERPSRRDDLASMQQLVAGTAAVYAGVRPPDAAWDDFLNGVYNRLERRAGWIFLCIGIAGLAIFGLVEFVFEPWASAIEKIILAAPVIGLAVLFISVLRHRLHARKTDRYEREVHH